MWPIISKGTLRSAYLVLRYRQNKLAKYDENNKNKSCIFDDIFKSISSNCTNKVSFQSLRFALEKEVKISILSEGPLRYPLIWRVTYILFFPRRLGHDTQGTQSSHSILPCGALYKLDPLETKGLNLVRFSKGCVHKHFSVAVVEWKNT